MKPGTLTSQGPMEGKTLGELGIFRTRKPITAESKEDSEKTSTLERKRREIVIPIKPSGQPYRQATHAPSFLKSSSKVEPTKSDDKKFSFPKVELASSQEPRSQKIVMRKKKETECSADTVISAKPVAKESASKTIITDNGVVTERATVSLSVSLDPPKKEKKLERQASCALEELEEEVERRLNKIAEKAEKLDESLKEAQIPHESGSVDNESIYSTPRKPPSSTQSNSPVKIPSQPASPLKAETAGNKDEAPAKAPRLSLTGQVPVIAPRVIESVEPPKPARSALLTQKPLTMLGKHASLDTEQKMHQKLASRVKEGIADLTQGSSDRLQRWKSKLQSSGRRLREKDGSAPPPLSRSMQSESPEVMVDWSVHPRPLHASRSATNALAVSSLPHHSATVDVMEHRTLKNRYDLPQYSMAGLRQPHYTGSFLSDLPPPARLVPFSGARAHEGSEIIRPIAFRPLGNTAADDMNKRHSGHFTQHHKMYSEHTKSALNLSNPVPNLPRQRPVFHPSTSYSTTSVNGKAIENEYDTVSDLLVEKSDVGSDCCKLSTSATSSSHGGSLTNRKSLNNGSRQSTGAHVTPSPSDSGIVDYETIIRDKENELRDVRTTMEQNEEIIVKVYLEKERAWKEQLDQMRVRLAASEKGEAALRQQMSSVSWQTEQMSALVAQLREEKAAMQNKINLLEQKTNSCENCRQRSRPVPAPRHIKETDDRDLRTEVSDLRRELSTLKETLRIYPNESTNNNILNSGPRDRLI